MITLNAIFVILLFALTNQKRNAITIYTESLCPDCKDFFINSFASALNTTFDFKNVMIIPFGDAELNKDKNGFEFVCQHGFKECYGNMIHSCTIDIIKERKKALEYIVCYEREVFINDDFNKTVSICVNDKKEANDIIKCASSERGLKLMRKMNKLTPSYIDYVPYIVVNGVHNKDTETKIIKNFTEYITEETKRINKRLK